VPKVSEAHREARRRQILEAAMSCFAREGFHRTSMQDIYARSGLSAGAVYGYFDSKDQIIEAIAGEAHRLAQTVAASGPADRDGSVDGLFEMLETLLGGFEHFDLARVEERVRMALQIWAEALRNPRVRTLERENVEAVRRAFAGMVSRGQATGQVDPGLEPDAVARSMIALFQGLVLQRTWYEEIDLDAYRAVVRAMLGGLRAPGDGVVR
jgi:AcrR family transcriptional regulator